MKNSLLLLPLFVLIFSLLFIFLTIINVLYLTISDFANTRTLSAAVLFNNSLSGMITVLPGTVLLSLVLLFFRMLNKPGNRFLSSLLITAAGVLILAGGMKLLLVLRPADVREARTTAAYLEAGSFRQIGERMLYTDKISGETISGATVADMAKETGDRRLFYYTEGSIRLAGSGAEVILEGRVRRKMTIDDGMVRPRVAEFNFPSGELLSAYSGLAGEIKRLAQEDQVSFYIFCLGFVFFIVTTNLFMRITKWPLFNFIFLIFILAGFFFLYNLFTTIVVNELGKLIKNISLPTYLPVIAMFVLGILFFFFDIVFIPFNLKEREAPGE